MKHALVPMSMLIVVVSLGLVVIGCQPAAPRPGVKAPTPPAAGGAGFDAFVKASKLPVARVPLVDKAPKVDGVMDDVYKQGTPMTFKFLSGIDGKVEAGTAAYAVSTKDTLYLFFECSSPNMKDLVATVKDHDGDVWKDDSVELFIDPSNKRTMEGYFHIAVNSLGTTAEATGGKANADYNWNPKLEVKTAVNAKNWTVELAIPFADLGVTAKQMNKVWAVNLNRFANLTPPEDTAWSPTGGTDSHVPSRFGCLWLDAGAVDNAGK